MEQPPIDHRAIIASLSPADRARLTERSDRIALGRLLVHVGLIAALGVLIAIRVPLWPLLMLPQGILIVFLFTLLHETIHGTAFATGRLNDWVARFCGFAIALPADWFRYFHFAHHRFTQDPDNDPELAFPKPETLRQYVVHVSGIPVWIGHARTLLTNALGRCRDSFVPPKGMPRVAVEARAMLAAYAVLITLSISTGSSLLLYVWVVPALLGQPFLRLYLLAEHGRCAYVANMLENTRTTLTNWLVRGLAWNMPYHAEHHSYPAVPFHKLPEFHDLIEVHLRETENGYARFHARYIGALR